MLPYSSNKQGIASLFTLISTFVLIAGLVAGVILTQKQQEIREKAAPQPCYVCLGIKECKKVADPPYCNTGNNECFVDENCKPTPTPKPTNTSTPVPCIADGKCTGPGELCCGKNDYFDLKCPVTETRCGIKPTLTPTPTPKICSVKYENRGCGRSGCVETAMWQLVTNSDCSITSRCVPNYPECLPSPTPTLTPKPTPTPYCSTGNPLRCLYGCEPDSYGGRCKSQPEPYCSDYMYDQCIYGCEPTLSGGKCKPAVCENLKTLEQCNAQNCAWYGCSTRCLPRGTSYVDAGCILPYCSTNNLLRCDYGCEPDSYGGRCKSILNCSENLLKCDYGCEPTVSGGKCKPVKCENLKTLEQCNAQYCEWYGCSTRCLPVGTDLVSAGCKEPCPSLLSLLRVNEECGFIGQTCESQNAYLLGQLYMCQNDTWQAYGELKILFDGTCSDEEKNKYRDNIGNLPLELHTNEVIQISCPDEGYKSRIIIGDVTYQTTACGNIRGNNITLSCNDPACQPNGYYSCQYIVNHELAHHQAGTTNLSSHEIESFNTTIGCKSNGKGSFSFEENPVTSYGRSNCAEAYAELIAQYIYYPCGVALHPDFSKQYEWLLTNPDSPFQGKELCKAEG